MWKSMGDDFIFISSTSETLPLHCIERPTKFSDSYPAHGPLKQDFMQRDDNQINRHTCFTFYSIFVTLGELRMAHGNSTSSKVESL